MDSERRKSVFSVGYTKTTEQQKRLSLSGLNGKKGLKTTGLLVVLFLFFWGWGRLAVHNWLKNEPKSQPVVQQEQVLGASTGQVKGIRDEVNQSSLVFRLPTNFKAKIEALTMDLLEDLHVFGDATIDQDLVVLGNGDFSGDVNVDGSLTLTNIVTGNNTVMNLGGSGKITTGSITASNIVYKLVAGNGIEISGTQEPTISVKAEDRASQISTFKKFKVGSDTIEADSNSDQLEIAAGAGITLSADTSNDKLTIVSSTGWTTSGTNVYVATTTNNVGIGTISPSAKLEVNSLVAGTAGLKFTQITSSTTAAVTGTGGGKVLAVDSGGNVVLVTDQVGDTPSAESVLPTSDSGGTLYYNGTNWAATTNLYHDGGKVGISTNNPQARLHIYTNLATEQGAIIQGYAAQSANLLEFQNSDGNNVSYFDSNGAFHGDLVGDITGDLTGSVNPGLTLGSVLFQGASGIAEDNANFFWDDSTNRLGIGTTGPSEKLHIEGNAYFSAGTYLNAGGTFEIKRSNSNRLALYSNTTILYSGNASTYFTTDNSKFTFTNGDVGIGTTSPTASLDVVGKGNFGDGGLSASSQLGQVNIYDTAPSLLLEYASGYAGNRRVVLKNNIDSGKSAHRLDFEVYNNTPSLDKTIMSLETGTGNVGIGTTSPGAQLDLYQAAGSDPSFLMGDGDVAHGLTSILPTTGTFKVTNAGPTSGGAWVVGASYGTTAQGLILNGIIGVADPADTAAAVLLTAGKKSGTTAAALGSLETAFQFENGAATGGTKLLTILGSGNVGIGDTTPSYLLTVGSGDLMGVNSSGYLLLPDGALSTPSLTFTGDTDTGLYRIGSDNLAIVAGGVNALEISSSKITSHLPHEFLSAGDVAIAYDLLFTNPTASFVKSDSSLYFEAGEVFNSSNLTFRTFNKGNVIVDSEALVANYAATVSGQLVVGTSVAPTNIGNLYVTNSSTYGKALAIFNQTESADIFTASASGVAKFVINSAGNVGIGTANPGQLLSLQKDQNAATQFRVRNDTSGTAASSQITASYGDWTKYSTLAQINPSYTTNGMLMANSTALLSYGNTNGMKIFTLDGYDITFGTNNTANMTLENGGNLGVGTTNPATKLEVSGSEGTGAGVTARVRNTSTDNYSFANLDLRSGAGDEGGQIIGSRSDVVINTYGVVNGLTIGAGTASQDIGFRVGTSLTGTSGPAMIIKASGNVGIGTTTFGTDAAKVLAIGNGTAPSTSPADGVQLYAIDYDDGDASSTSELFVRDEDGNATNLSPHNFDIIPDGKSEDLAWSYFSIKNNNKAIGADMTKALRLVEQISGEKLIYIKDLVSGEYIDEGKMSVDSLGSLKDNTQTLADLNLRVQDLETKILGLQTSLEEVGQTSGINSVILEEYLAKTELNKYAQLAVDQWQFISEVSFKAKTEFLALVTFKDKVKFEGQIELNQDQIGRARIKAGDKEVKVDFTSQYPFEPVVTITPVGFIGKYQLKEVKANSFTIELTDIQSQDVVFTWNAFGGEQIREATSAGQLASPTPLPGVLPSPSPSPIVSPSPINATESGSTP